MYEFIGFMGFIDVGLTCYFVDFLLKYKFFVLQRYFVSGHRTYAPRNSIISSSMAVDLEFFPLNLLFVCSVDFN